MKATTTPRITAKGSGRLLTLTYAIRGVERRMLTIDLFAPPEPPYELQLWFLRLVGLVWWDIREPESFVVSTRVADEMAALLRKHRAERQEEMQP